MWWNKFCWHCLKCDGDTIDEKDPSKFRCYGCEICGNKHYPSWSNLSYYIPIVKWFRWLCDEVQDRYYEYIENKNYISEYETKSMKYIWGLSSYDDLSGNDTNLFTMNDFDLIYLKNEDKYILDVETIYMFNTKDDEKEYMKSILDLFTKWMIKNGYDIFNEISLFEMFTQGLNINSQFDSIEQAYAVFKALVKGYCNQ